MNRRQAGYTLVELVAVMTVAGVLSALAAMRMLDRGQRDARGYADRLAATLQFAQKAAVAQRRLVHVNIDTAARRVRACLDPGCVQPLAAPAGGTLELDGSGITVASAVAQFTFDGLGRPSIASRLTLSVGGGGSTFDVSVEPDTGHVRGP